MEHRSDLPLIICFGDSLTAGYQSPIFGESLPRETPYGAFLQERIGARARVAVSGICGETTGEMVLRFHRDVLVHAPHAVVILGGTNDLGWYADPPEIMRNLVQMYEQACAAGVQPIAVTVPSIRLEGGDDERRLLVDHIARRRLLNRLIADSCKEKGIECVDLFTATAEKPTLCLAAPYSNDGLHLTTQGYGKFAAMLHEQVFKEMFNSQSSP